MLLYLFPFLVDISPIIRMGCALLTSFFFLISIAPWCIHKLSTIKAENSIRVSVCPGLAELHENKKKIPTMGGAFLLLAIVVSLFLWMDLQSMVVWMFCMTIVWLGGIGAYDDYLKLKYKNSNGMGMKKKFTLQILFALLIGCYGLQSGMLTKTEPREQPLASLESSECKMEYYIPFYKKPIIQLTPFRVDMKTGFVVMLVIFFTIFVITGSSNAVNLTDGLDGLSSGCVMLTSAVLAIAALISSHPSLAEFFHMPYIKHADEIAIVLSATMGACLGFLWFNGYPAQVFMGDTGSLALGGILGVTAVFLRQEFLLALVGGVFVIETLSVILQVASYRWRHKKRIFLCSPLHHHFEYKGWKETKVVMRFWIIGCILASLGLMSILGVS